MQRRLRVLVLACCLPLVLPPGWCCWGLPGGPSPAKAGPQTADGLCCCHVNDEPPSDGKRPEPHRNPRLKYCPCTDRNTIKQSVVTVEKASVSVAFIAMPFASGPLSVAAGIGDGSDSTPIRPPPCLLHVLNCVWRC
jgi:hypothetical protein